MAESAALLVDDSLPQRPMRQWVLSVPFQLRFLFASQPEIMGKALGIVYRAISTHITKKSGHTKTTAHTGAVTLIQRFGSALNLNVHLHTGTGCRAIATSMQMQSKTSTTRCINCMDHLS